MLGIGLNPFGQPPSFIQQAANSIPDTINGQLLEDDDAVGYFQLPFTTPDGDNQSLTAQAVIQPVTTAPTLNLWVAIGVTGAARTRVTLDMTTGAFSGQQSFDGLGRHQFGSYQITPGTFLVWWTSETIQATGELEQIRLTGVSENIRVGAFQVSLGLGPKPFVETTGTPTAENLLNQSDGSNGVTNSMTATPTTITVR